MKSLLGLRLRLAPAAVATPKMRYMDRNVTFKGEKLLHICHHFFLYVFRNCISLLNLENVMVILVLK
jgi:hypothetical protein